MRWIILLAPLLVFTYAFADAPASRPSTRPDGPRDVYKTFCSAMWKGLPDDVAPNCDMRDAEYKQVVDDMTDLAVAVGAIRKAAQLKFGAAGSEAVNPMMDSPDVIDHSTESIDGDHALVQFEDGHVTPLVKVDGAWKMDIAGEFKRERTTAAQAHRMFVGMIRATRQTTADITAGKYPDAEATHAALDAAESNALSVAASTTAPSPQ